MTTSDEMLARAANGGDRDAFATLLQRHYDRIFRIAFRLTGHPDIAEDLTQDICAALPRKMASFRNDARFTTWLYRVVVNAAEDNRRRARTRERTASTWADVEKMRQAEMTEQAEALEWLRSAMSALSEDLRDTLALTMEDGMTHAEAAQILGVSEGTVSWRLSEIRKRLKALREQELGGL